MYTASQVVDELVEESLRPDMTLYMQNSLNLTTRECHFTVGDPNSPAMPVGYASNLYELALTPNVDTGFSWDIPDGRLFQMMEAVYYATFDRYATERRPSNIRAFLGNLDGAEYSWYRSGDTVAFSNYGGTDSEIDLAWFQYLPGLKYYPVGARPCEWNDDDQDFDYFTVNSIDYGSTPELQAQAQLLCTNWMIQRWRDLLMQGVRAKIWSRLADDNRMRTAYSSYQNLRPQMVTSETYDRGPRYRR